MAMACDELWLFGGREQPATWRRLASLRALGVLHGEDAPLVVGCVADFLTGAADAIAERGHVAHALGAAARKTAGAAEGALVAAGETERAPELVGADRECASALAAVLDTLGPGGEAEVAAGAYRLRAALGRRRGRPHAGQWRLAPWRTRLQGA
eukprot:2976828-Pleurochrysis_carterae.AAC.1